MRANKAKYSTSKAPIFVFSFSGGGGDSEIPVLVGEFNTEVITGVMVSLVERGYGRPVDSGAPEVLGAFMYHPITALTNVVSRGRGFFRVRTLRLARGEEEQPKIVSNNKPMDCSSCNKNESGRT
jgi:hypothetical protein